MATVLPGVEKSPARTVAFCFDTPEPNDLPSYGDFRRIHRMGLIACSYRAAESRHKEIELTADELLQYLDTKSERRRKR